MSAVVDDDRSAEHAVAFTPEPETQPELAEPAETPTVLLEAFPSESVPEPTLSSQRMDSPVTESLPSEPPPSIEAVSCNVPAASSPEESPPAHDFADHALAVSTPAATNTIETSTGDDSVEMSRREKATLVLDKARRLQLREGPELTALEACREQASSLLEALASRPEPQLDPHLAALASGDHPLSKIVTAVEGTSSLDDTEWTELYASISENYGRELATAVARSRVTIKTD
jgi:hypothetical protein